MKAFNVRVTKSKHRRMWEIVLLIEDKYATIVCSYDFWELSPYPEDDVASKLLKDIGAI